MERQLFNLATTIQRQELNPAVIVWNYSADDVWARRLRDADISVYSVGSNGGALGRLRRLRALIGAMRPEVLHAYSFYLNFPAWWAAQSCRAVVIGSLRNEYGWERSNAGLIRGTLCTIRPRVLVSNNFSAKAAADSDRSWFAPRRVEFVPNAVDLGGYPLTHPPVAGRFEVLGIGRLERQKAWQDALHALALFDKNNRSDWRFRLCGEGQSLDSLRSECRALGLASRVEFLGYRIDTPALLASSHVLLLSSHSEGTPNVVLEAMASGRPVVATRVGDIGRLVTHGCEGFVVAPGDVQGLAAGLAALVSDRRLVETMGANARRNVERELDLPKLAERLLQIYCANGWKQ